MVVAALALILALVAPAIGGKSGPSTSKLAKQLNAERAGRGAAEAALQAQLDALKLKQGPPGPPGPGAVKVDFDVHKSDPADYAVVATVDELTLKAKCQDGPSGVSTYHSWRLNSSVAATFNGTVFQDTDDAPGTTSTTNFGVALPAAQDTGIYDAEFAGINSWTRQHVVGTYSSGLQVMSLDLTAISNEQSGRCQLQGTIVPTA